MKKINEQVCPNTKMFTDPETTWEQNIRSSKNDCKGEVHMNTKNTRAPMNTVYIL